MTSGCFEGSVGGRRSMRRAGEINDSGESPVLFIRPHLIIGPAHQEMNWTDYIGVKGGIGGLFFLWRIPTIERNGPILRRRTIEPQVSTVFKVLATDWPTI